MTHKEVTEIFHRLQVSNWKIGGQLAGSKSGQATVAEVTRVSDGKKGAFRLLNSNDEISKKRFLREVRILTAKEYKHPNIINILDYSLDEYWYISELGSSFKDHWQSIQNTHNGMPDSLLFIAIKYINFILEGLIPLHKMKVVHRDIKPNNLVIKDGIPVLIDFGLVFIDNEERVTPIDSAVGNARFSPDQMMNRLEDVPPWLDIFQISQLLLWMTTEKPTKNWNRPLDWRWVIYPASMSSKTALSLRAFTAVCSDIFTSPSNAEELKTLIQNLFLNDLNLDHPNPKATELIDSIRSGKAKSYILASTDFAIFNSSLLLFSQIYLEIENYLRRIVKSLENVLTIKFHERESLESWIERIQSREKFVSHENFSPFVIICGDQSQGHFWIDCGVGFLVPSQIVSQPGTDYLPVEFLPLWIEFGIGSHLNLLQRKGKAKTIYVSLDKTGQLWHSRIASEFKSNRQAISLNLLIENLESWVMDTEAWEIINT